MAQNNFQVNGKELTRGLNSKKSINFFSNLSSEELLKLYHCSGLFVSASEYEGFGLASMEALASGSLLMLHPNQSFLDLFCGLGEFADFERPDKVLEAFNLISSMNEKDLMQRAAFGLAKSEIFSWKKASTRD